MHAAARTLAAISTAVLSLAMSACGGGDDDASEPTSAATGVATTEPGETTVAPATEAPETTEAATTTRAPTTTAAPTTTIPPVPNYTGIVWNSAVDPARINTTEPIPTFEADGVTSRIEMVLVVPRTAPGDLGAQCAEEAEFRQEFEGGDLAEQCLYVQWSFDVAPDFRVDENSPDASISADALITPEGKQISSVFAATAFPGTVDNFLGIMFAGGTAGSTLKFSSGSNLVGHTTHTYLVPPVEGLQPIFWES